MSCYNFDYFRSLSQERQYCWTVPFRIMCIILFLQANIAKSLLGIAHTESTITFGANLSPLKLLDAMNEPINPSSSPLLRHYPPNTARSRVCRYPSSVHPPPLHPAQKPPEMKEI
uniref:Uncharacterized protein n=1 Tax=Opuntia streptacantha TaxID=393608 RepID=A0A7C9E1X7_OPUST